MAISLLTKETISKHYTTGLRRTEMNKTIIITLKKKKSGGFTIEVDKSKGITSLEYIAMLEIAKQQVLS
jgi:hypothetical protein